MKTYKLKGIEYYATECRNEFHAVLTFMSNGLGITKENIEEFKGEIPKDAVKVFEGV